jgi:hypothetical protein
MKKLKEVRSSVDLSPSSRTQEIFATGETGICTLVHGSKQAHESNASIDVTHLKEKALHIARSTDLRDTTLFTEFCQVKAGVLMQKL